MACDTTPALHSIMSTLIILGKLTKIYEQDSSRTIKGTQTNAPTPHRIKPLQVGRTSEVP